MTGAADLHDFWVCVLTVSDNIGSVYRNGASCIDIHQLHLLLHDRFWAFEKQFAEYMSELKALRNISYETKGFYTAERVSKFRQQIPQTKAKSAVGLDDMRTCART